MTGQWRKPLDFSEATLTAARAQAETLRNALRGETRTRGDWRASHRCSRTTSTRRRRSRSSTNGRTGAFDELRRGLDVFGLAGLRAGAGAARGGDTRRRTRGHAARATSPRPTGFVTRSRERVEVRDVASRLRARAALVTRDLVYGRNAGPRGARGRRAVLELWVSERAVAGLEWLHEGPRPRVHKERELTEAAGTSITRASSPGASRTRTRTPGSSLRWSGR